MHLAHNRVLHAGCENEVDFLRTLAGGVPSPIHPSILLFCGLRIALNFSLPFIIFFFKKGINFLS